MNNEAALRALVVDDEALARRMIMWSLGNEGFHCTPAIDGVDAMDKIKQVVFDLIVTDLRMPNKHGHALATELLMDTSESRPMLVAHSSIDDPRMTKDLMLRGVDDVVYKPTNYAAFAAKMKGAVLRRRQLREGKLSPKPSAAAKTVVAEESQQDLPTERISLEEFDARLADVAHILPVSNTAIRVLRLLKEDDFDAHSLAKTIGDDAVLTMEMLRLANHGVHGRPGRKILDLSEAIARLGARRVGEISLAVCALGGMTKLVLPWFDKALARRRSLAACIAVKQISRLQPRPVDGEGIASSALIYPLARVVVGSAYSNVYQSMVAECTRKGNLLRSAEPDIFPRTPAAATAQVLLRMGLPIEVWRPLSYADLSFESIASLPEQARSSTTLLKTAILLAEQAVGNWKAWEDSSESPPEAILKSLHIRSADDIIASVRSDLDLALGIAAPPAPPAAPAAPRRTPDASGPQPALAGTGSDA